jgi:hypothetical protein
MKEKSMQRVTDWMKAHKIWTAIIGFVVVVAACNGVINGGRGGTSSDVTPTATTGQHVAQATATPKPKPTATPLPKVGSTITVDKVSVTLMSVTTIQGDEFSQPKAGNEFILVTVKMVNNSGSEQSYSSTDFHVRSSSGNITNAEIVCPSTYTANNELSGFGHLTNGGSVTGDICLQAPVGDHGARLTWQPGFGNTGDNGWLLGL